MPKNNNVKQNNEKSRADASGGAQKKNILPAFQKKSNRRGAKPQTSEQKIKRNDKPEKEKVAEKNTVTSPNQTKKESAARAVRDNSHRSSAKNRPGGNDKTVRHERNAAEGSVKSNRSVDTKKNNGKRQVKGRGDTAEIKAYAVPRDDSARVRIIPLGGLNEIGKNMTAIECGDDIIVIDCGLAFPDDETPGVDLVIPDVTYLEANASRVRGIVLTHGHEDHIGAIPYVLRNINPPIYGTRLTVGIVRNKLKEFTLDVVPKLIEVKAGDVIRLGGMTVEFIHVNHSIADACALAVRTPLGTIVHSGDFKLDLTPIDSEIMDITRLGEIGKEGVLLLMCESTNAERPGSTPSERKVGASLEYIFSTHDSQRIVIATFSSNVHRVQQIIDTSYRHGRKVAVTGRSMLNIVGAAVELGYMHVPKGVLIDISEINKYNPEQITLVTTGSQGLDNCNSVLYVLESVSVS